MKPCEITQENLTLIDDLMRLVTKEFPKIVKSLILEQRSALRK
jgi:hypothetical protein